MANQASPKYIKESQARAITYKVLCGIVKLYGEATVPEIRAKYKSISRPWNLPYIWVTEESAIAYLNQLGIASSRLVARGYGERQPVNHCRDGVKCSEEEHQLNRRTEFKIIKM